MIIIYTIIALNIFGFLIMGYDKGLAKFHGRRIPERILFLIAAVGGAVGVYGGMKLFHHKTKHPTFVYGIPLLIGLNFGLFLMLDKYKKVFSL